ncbi:hypothetical protein J2T13_001284 [Paenibacillus sp. DS2015]
MINSAPVSRQMLTAGRYWVCVFRWMSEDPDCSLQIHAVKFDGELLAV